jgi:uncharacterized membrane protein
MNPLTIALRCLRRGTVSAFLVGVVALLSMNGRAADYSITELSPVDGDVESTAAALNEAGVAVGISSDAEGQPQAVRWDPAGTAERLIPSVRTYSAARDINEDGKIAGYMAASGGAHAALWDANLVRTDLHQSLSGIRSEAFSINDEGVVVGFTQSAGAFPLGFVYHPVEGVEIFSINGAFSSRAFSVNQHRAIAASALGSSTQQAILRKEGQDQLLPHLPTGQFGQIVAVNNSGHAAGFSDQADGQELACCWINGVATSLGHLGGGQSQAFAINNFGYVVGTSLNDQPNEARQEPEQAGTDYLGANNTLEQGDAIVDHDRARAFLWNGDSMIDLNDSLPLDSGWILLSAEDINDRGQIVGYGIKGGKLRGFLLTPTAQPTPDLALTLPQSDLIVPQGNTLSLHIDANHVSDQVKVYLDDQLQQTASTGSAPFQPGTLTFGSHVLRVETLDNENRVVASKELSIQVRDLLFAEWLTRYLGAENGPGTGAGDDPDEDGLTVLEEFAYNLFPHVSEDPSQIPLTLEFDKGQPYLVYKRRKAFNNQGLGYVLRASGNMTQWDDVTNDTSLQSQESDGGADPMETVRYLYQGEKPDRLFFQVEVIGTTP